MNCILLKFSGSSLIDNSEITTYVAKLGDITGKTQVLHSELVGGHVTDITYLVRSDFFCKLIFKDTLGMSYKESLKVCYNR